MYYGRIKKRKIKFNNLFVDVTSHFELSLTFIFMYKAKLVEHFLSAGLTFYASQFLIFRPITINMTLICELCKRNLYLGQFL